jgi:hypothetical protein
MGFNGSRQPDTKYFVDVARDANQQGADLLAQPGDGRQPASSGQLLLRFAPPMTAEDQCSQRASLQ